MRNDIKTTPGQRYRDALAEIRNVNECIGYHEKEVKRLRGVRDRFKRKRDRALATMERVGDEI